MKERIKKEMSEWRIHKSINLGDILTMIGMLTAVCIAFLAVWLGLRDDISSNRNQITMIESRMDLQEQQYKYDRLEMGKRFDRLERMLQDIYLKDSPRRNTNE